MLLLLALRYLPPEAPLESTLRRRLRDAGLAILAGIGVAALTWGILIRPPQPELAEYFLATSLPGGGGANVVNVILVDFRGFDTLGEATVLVIAALGIAALLSGGLPLPTTVAPSVARPEARWPLLVRMGARPVLALTLLLAAYIFLDVYKRQELACWSSSTPATISPNVMIWGASMRCCCCSWAQCWA